MFAIVLLASVSCAIAAGAPLEEKNALREAKHNYKTQMGYQGHYPKEAAELKQEYHDKVAAIKSKYQAADKASSAAPVLLASVGESDAEKAALREAKQNYKTQMQYQGHYPKEAAELNQEYHDKVAAIKSKYQAADEASSAEPLLLASVGESDAEKTALREAKHNYKTQMQYQGHYPKEAAELKQEYHDKVAAIKSKYQAPDEASSAEPLLLASVGESDAEKAALREAKQNYKTQMYYAGHYPKEAAELKQEYNHKVEAIKNKYQAADEASSAEPVLLASVGESDAEKAALHAAKQNYKTQMQYQGHYPKEAAELNQEYHDKVAAIKSKYSATSDASSADPVLLASVDESDEEKAALREAKHNYKTQMQYQGHYPKEAAELKQEYHNKVAAIKSKYQADDEASSAEPMLLASVDESDAEKAALREAKQNYKTQMYYAGHYPKEAAELKQEYNHKVEAIKSKYDFSAAPAAGALAGIAAACSYMRFNSVSKLQEPLLHS